MNKQKNSISSAELICHVLIDFSSEGEMELFINHVEKKCANFYENMKKFGLMLFRLNKCGTKKVDLHYQHYLNIKTKMPMLRDKKL